MTEEVKPNFLESVEFEKEFLPFKKDTKIEFGGEQEVQRMIEFYLKNKGIENYKENAKRFKINCVLGNNGGGKSRLFEWIYGFFINPRVDYTPSEKKYNGCIYLGQSLIKFPYKGLPLYNFNNKSTQKNIFSLLTQESVGNYALILDDFFKLSGNIYFSVNNSTLEYKNLNKFYCETYNFLNDDSNLIELFRTYLNINDSDNINIKITDINDDKINVTEISLIYSEIKNSCERLQYMFLLYLSNNIKHIFDYTTQNNKYVDSILTYVDGFKNTSKEYEEINSIFGQYEFYFKYLRYKDNGGVIELDISDILDDISNLKYYSLGGKSDDYYYELLELKNKYYDLNWEKSNIEALENDLIYDQSENKLKNQTEENLILEDISSNLSNLLISIEKDFNNLNNFHQLEEYWQDEEEYFSFNKHKDKIHFFSNLFKLDLVFDDGESDKKTFESLSAGEKTILLRFSNIYRSVLNLYNKENGKTDFLILIDEPDLHLHLDWQRQYIQKLIDVFSTLDSEISLHFIIATHSPFIISDLSTESIIILDGGENNEHQGTFTEVKNYSEKITIKNKDGKEIEKFKYQTFGANYIDIIKNGFFFEDKMLMGSFAQENIERTSKRLKAKLFIESLHINDKNFETKKSLLNDILKEIGENKVDDFGDFENYKSKYFEGIENIQNHIGDDFLQDNLMYLN